MSDHHEHFMQLAVDAARKQESPFGAVITMGDDVIVTAANETDRLFDPTAHAEVQALRKLGETIHDTSFEGYTLYTTGEPCPMCATACIWANIGEIYYGLSIPEISRFMPQVEINSEKMLASGFRHIPVYGGILASECRALFLEFS